MKRPGDVGPMKRVELIADLVGEVGALIRVGQPRDLDAFVEFQRRVQDASDGRELLEVLLSYLDDAPGDRLDVRRVRRRLQNDLLDALAGYLAAEGVPELDVRRIRRRIETLGSSPRDTTL